MKKLLVLLVVAVLAGIVLPSPVMAQGEVRLVILPVDQEGSARGPEYLKWRFNPDGLDVPWSCKDYGLSVTMLCAVEVAPAQIDYLAAQAGVLFIPADLEANPTPAELSALETRLEQGFIPADWLSPSDTWRVTMRTVGGMFLAAQRYSGITGEAFENSGVTLNTQLRNMPQYVQDALEQIATENGYPWQAEVKDNWTARIILKWFADQWGETPIIFGGLLTL